MPCPTGPTCSQKKKKEKAFTYSHVKDPIQREAAALIEQRLLGRKRVAKNERHDPGESQDRAS